MKARIYDPATCRFLSPDPYIQAPEMSLNYNRYAYCMNNPINNIDPSGEKWWHWVFGDIFTGGLVSSVASLTGFTVYASLFPFTETCYEIQKYISPIAFKPSFNFGSVQNGIGFDVSFGMLKGAHGYRFNHGATYYWSNYGGYNGWETRRGGEVELKPFVSYSGTKFKSGKFSQTTGMWSLGDPFTNMKYENDMDTGVKFIGVPYADGGDRFRTAAVQLNFGVFSVNLNMFTGDPGLYEENQETYIDENEPKYKTYISGTSNVAKYRAGVISIGFGPFRIGENSEDIRNSFQNDLIHKNQGSPLFQKLNTSPMWYWYFGFGSGNTLW